MQNSNLSVFVITRFGIGQKSNVFFDKEFLYMKNLLIKSIIKQSELITKWIILTDINAPKDVVSKLKKLIPKDILLIYFHDSFSEGSLKPNYSNMLEGLGVKHKDRVITIRVDADDIISNDYICSVINAINSSNSENKYDLISVNATSGVYFYPTRKKLVKVFKKDFSIQALYSIFGNNFNSVYDVGHQKLEQMVLSQGGYCCQLNKKEYWVRSMRQHSVTQFGKKFGILVARFDFLKNIIKFLLYKFLKNNTFYRGKIKINYLFSRFELTDKIVPIFYKHEEKLENKKIVFSPFLEEIINSKKLHSPLQVKQYLLDMHKIEKEKEKKIKIKKEFYSF